jgi:transposase-like protein
MPGSSSHQAKALLGRLNNKVSVLVAIGVDKHGSRQMLGVKEGAKEYKESWMDFLRQL